MTASSKYKLVASALVLGAVLVASGIWGTFSSAMQPPENAKHTLGLGEWVYLKNDQGKKYLGSYLGTYVVSTGGCNLMRKTSDTTWWCIRHTTQNGWGVLYKKVKTPKDKEDFVVSDIQALLPITNNVGNANTFEEYRIVDSIYGAGHDWSGVERTLTGQVGVDLVLYNASEIAGQIFE